MIPEVTILITVVKTLILVLGGAITGLSYRAYRTTNDQGLGLLTAGFATITTGAAIGGIITELLGYPFRAGVLVESSLVLVGFCIIAASLYIEP